MIDRTTISGLIFDYGGTIDSNGDHWSEVIWDAYCQEGVPVSKAEFRQAYVYAERALALHPYIRPEHNFLDLLRIKMEIQLDFLVGKTNWPDDVHPEVFVKNIADYCYGFARASVHRARKVLDRLSEHYPMVLVSNFYGNIETVLADFHLADYFQSVVESAVVGVRKPDPEIFAIGVRRLGLNPAEVVVIGDSYQKDIEPAMHLGCQTVWIKGRAWDDRENGIVHEQIIHHFVNLEAILL